MAKSAGSRGPHPNGRKPPNPMLYNPERYAKRVKSKGPRNIETTFKKLLFLFLLIVGIIGYVIAHSGK